MPALRGCTQIAVFETCTWGLAFGDRIISMAHFLPWFYASRA